MLVRVVTSGFKAEWEIEVPRWVWGLKNKGLCALFSSSGGSFVNWSSQRKVERFTHRPRQGMD